MALHDGFFDAAKIDPNGPDDYTNYDRTYGPDDFVNYFANFIGKGVCVRDNPDSYKVTYQNGNAVVADGYLFINGHWQRNEGGYNIPLADTGEYAIVANLGNKIINLTAQPKESTTPSKDSLILAYVTVGSDGAATVEDTRYNSEICGVIDSAGSVSSKVDWAINYINTEVNTKLEEARQEIETKALALDRSIAEANAAIDSVSPPPVGTIKFSASQNVDKTWLKCDGSFVNEKDYPALVAALGKLIPDSNQFKLLSDGEIGTKISNGAVYDGRMWVYSYSTKKLYGVDLDGEEPVKEIEVTSEEPAFQNFVEPSTLRPICLSVVKHKVGGGAKLFLAQCWNDGITRSETYKEYLDYFLVFQSEFSGDEIQLNLTVPFNSRFSVSFSAGQSIPYVVSKLSGGKEKYLICLCVDGNNVRYAEFDGSGEQEIGITSNAGFTATYHQRVCFSHKSKDELVKRYTSAITSLTNGIFDGTAGKFSTSAAKEYNAVNIVGNKRMIEAFNLTDPVSVFSTDGTDTADVKMGLSLPPLARVFVDGGGYLWGRDIYLIFVGTGIIFSRTLETGSFGYLDTTSVMGVITQYGYLDYSEDEGTIYLLGQSTDNRVKVAKMVLNELYDYANDGAWLPMIAADGVPAYIKAFGDDSEVPGEPGGDDDDGDKDDGMVDMTINVSYDAAFGNSAELLFNGEKLISHTYTRRVSKTGNFTVGVKVTSKLSEGYRVYVTLGGNNVADSGKNPAVGTQKSQSFKVSDYFEKGITLRGYYSL